MFPYDVTPKPFLNVSTWLSSYRAKWTKAPISQKLRCCLINPRIQFTAAPWNLCQVPHRWLGRCLWWVTWLDLVIVLTSCDAMMTCAEVLSDACLATRTTSQCIHISNSYSLYIQTHLTQSNTLYSRLLTPIPPYPHTPLVPTPSSRPSLHQKVGNGVNFILCHHSWLPSLLLLHLFLIRV